MSHLKPSNHTAGEHTPLINGGAGGASSSHDHSDQRDRHPSLVFLFDSNHTPGLENESFAIRSLIYSWHITKVTLLSSTALLRIRTLI